jgi:SnoaL-like protein
MDARVAAQRWCETWERAWRGHDHGDIAALYADDAVLEAHAARRPENYYIEPTLAAGHTIECEFDEPLVDGDRAAAAWRAKRRSERGGSEQLAGVSLLRFDTAGLVIHQLDSGLARRNGQPSAAMLTDVVEPEHAGA